MSGRVRQFLGRLGAMVLALLLAFVIWVAATLEADPFVSIDVPNIPLTVVGQPDNTVLLQTPADTVTASVRGPQSELRRLTASDFTATLDLSTVTLGKATSVPVQVGTDKPIVRILSRSPSQQTVLLEAVESITLPVKIALRGQPALGYQAQPPIITPSEVRVRGPASLLAQVEVISATLGLQGARENIDSEVAVEPRDAAGRIISGLEWTPARVGVQVAVRKKIGFKPDVTVIPELRGDPAPGYRRGGVTVEPSTVTLAGVPSVLDEMPAFVRTQPITITGATANLSVRAPLTVPQNVAVVDVQYVTVTLEVMQIESSRIVTAPIEVQGLSAGLAARTSPSYVQVILVGPDPVLSELKPGDVRVVVNLFDYTLGVHRISPIVLAPERVSTVSVIPETVEVVIEPAPAVRPTAVPSAAPTP
jgi:YbbR domain-containing protein